MKRVEVYFPKSLNVQKEVKMNGRKFTGQKVALCCWVEVKVSQDHSKH